MHVLHCFRSAIRRTVLISGLAAAGLVGAAATSFAATPADGSAAAGSGSAATIGGLSVTTVAWVVVGVAFLVIGLLAASRSGNRTATVLDRGSVDRLGLSELQLPALRSRSLSAVDTPAGAVR